ncbi:unnamed protein product [Aureobasidium vineae]|uniref:YDG domain-containing protein n=1 Tax=Aureobasidium vineae TaxID=2773715 RepID=A0A9N8JW86_9PEZI|nr:unnamed protein product [Aureobasidium vineae]
MVDQPAFSAWKLPTHIEKASVLDLNYLKGRVSWIRDELDPLVARDGPNTLRPDTVIVLFRFFEQLRTSYLNLETIRDSRVHLALIEISRRATRWPVRLIEEAEEIIFKWESEWGPLSSIKVNLYDTGGRLHGISTPEDIQREALLLKWSRKETAWVNPNFARRNGDLGFQPGDGVTNCYSQAYALLLADGDEVDCTDPAHFTYRSTPGDSRRYRLCAGTLASRRPIRVLRSHTLRSFFAPRAGIRYDGLYKVSGWRIIQDPKTKAVHYYISFDRLPSEPPLGPILEHPNAEELDDYREYKRIRKEIRQHRNLLRHGLRFGANDTPSTSTQDRISIPKKTDSNDTTKTIKKPVAKRRGSSLHIQTSPSEPASDSNTPAKSDENPFFASPDPDDNPFFSGGLDSQTGLGKINTLRPDMINYAPVLQKAASAAGAAIDPFFANALEEHAAKKAAAFRLSISPPVSPASARPKKLGLGGRKSMIGFIGVIPEADEQKGTPHVRRDSQSPVLSKS